jgi:hypothetical protein
VVDEHCDAGDPFEGRCVDFQVFIRQVIREHVTILFLMNYSTTG